MKNTQRFIAGATCPQCQQRDSLLLDSIDQRIRCVDCNFEQSAAERAALDKNTGNANQKNPLQARTSTGDTTRKSSTASKIKPSEVIPITQVKL